MNLSGDMFQAVNFNGTECAKILLNGVPVWTRDTTDNYLYSVGLLSDVHIQTSTTEASKSQADFANALNYFSQNGCDMVCISGDITDAGTDAEFAKYKEIRDANKGSMNVFEVTGNHEAASSRTYTSIITEQTCIAHHIQALTGNHYCYYVKKGQYTYWDLSPENYTVDTAQNVTVYDDSIDIPESDVYIFVGILGERNNGLFWDGFFQWFYKVLEENKHKRCFIFEHCRAERLVWDSSAAAYVDDTYKDYVSGNTNGVYLKPLWGDATSNPHTKTMESLLAHFTNCVWFHGHTHLVAECGSVSEIANVDKFFGNQYQPYSPANSANNTRWTWSIHLPSVAEPRELGTGANAARSQGAIMDVYQRHIEIRYIDFAQVSSAGTITYGNQLIDGEEYILDTSIKGISKYTPPTTLISV